MGLVRATCLYVATRLGDFRLAFRDRVKVTLDGKTIRGESAKRDVWVCGSGAFVAMKALALRGRGENKDAYDVAYFIRNYPGGLGALAARLAPLLAEPEATEAGILARRLRHGGQHRSAPGR